METFSRYSRDPKLQRNSFLGTSSAIYNIRRAARVGDLSIVRTIVISDLDRLDNLAAVFYGDARLWWVLAAASDIGWGMQVPPGTVIRVADLRQVEELIT